MKAERPSRTAELVAAGVICAGKEKAFHELVDPRAVQLHHACLRHSSMIGALTSYALCVPPLRGILNYISKRVLPGLLRHFVMRKRFIAALCKDALKKGANCVCVIGAGLDALEYCLETDGLEVALIEIDHPATQRVKRETVLSLRPSTKIQFVSSDLSVTNPETLLRTVIKDQHRPVFILEGLLMYLTESNIRELLRGCSAAANGNATAILTYLERNDRGKVSFRKSSDSASSFLSWSREEFRWGGSDEEMKAIAHDCGFEVTEIVRTWENRKRFNIPEDIYIAEGESLAVLQSTKASCPA